MKIRKSDDGIHLFDRNTGMNILLDEVTVPQQYWSRAPRFVSIALTNLCDLSCPFCYAPKEKASLEFDQLSKWAIELDTNECMGIGFGGGEPTLYPKFTELCKHLAEITDLSISFTTHAHRLTTQIRNDLIGSIQFIRVSMDGVHDTYEKIRNRPFKKLLEQLQLVSDIAPFGINYVVNAETISDLDEAIELTLDAGASELLLLPEYSEKKLEESTEKRLMHWVSENHNRIPLAISEASSIEGIPIANPFNSEEGTNAYIHVNAFGKVSHTSYQQSNAISINKYGGILAAIKILEGEY